MAYEHEPNSQITSNSHCIVSTACDLIDCYSFLAAKALCAMGISILTICNGQDNHPTASLAWTYLIRLHLCCLPELSAVLEYRSTGHPSSPSPRQS